MHVASDVDQKTKKRLTSVADYHHIKKLLSKIEPQHLWLLPCHCSETHPHCSILLHSILDLILSPDHFQSAGPVCFHPKMEVSEITEEVGGSGGKKIFVAGATGSTGKRIVEQLLAKGFLVKAGVRDVEKAKTTFTGSNPALQFVKADVTEGPDKLAEIIGDDSEAVICATGFRPSWDLLAPWKVDNFGTVNLVDACRKRGINRFILISSILVNGAAMGQLLNPAYIFLNVFGLTLVAKLQAEQYIRKSGINYTIVRPGGLRNDPPSGNIVMEPEDTLYSGSISRDQVAEVAVAALALPQSHFKVVEIVASPEAPKKSLEELFDCVKQK